MFYSISLKLHKLPLELFFLPREDDRWQEDRDISVQKLISVHESVENNLIMNLLHIAIIAFHDG